MHRRKLLALLDSYATRYPAESATLRRFVTFVREHQRCFERDCWAGHVTGSAWVVDPDGRDVLLTHHRKLDIWVQLGGHSDGNADTAQVAAAEAIEEGGIPVNFLSAEIFDVDIHEIPARKSDPAHFHYDVRFAFQAAHRSFVVSEESNELAWVPIAELKKFTQETSMLRMKTKWENNELAGIVTKK